MTDDEEMIIKRILEQQIVKIMERRALKEGREATDFEIEAICEEYVDDHPAIPCDNCAKDWAPEIYFAFCRMGFYRNAHEFLH